MLLHRVPTLRRLQLDLPRLRPPDMSHRRAELRRLEGSEGAVWLRDADIVGDVGVGPRLCRRVRELRRRGLLQYVLGVRLVAAAHEVLLVPLPRELELLGRWQTLVQVGIHPLQMLLLLLVLLRQLHRRRLIHGELGHGRHHPASRPLDARLEVVDALGELERALATLERLRAQAIRQVAHLLEHQILLQQLLLLVVDALLQHLQLGSEVLGLGVLALELAPPFGVLRRLQLAAQLVRQPALLLELRLQRHDLLLQLGHLGQLPPRHLDLTAQLSHLQVEHPDLLLALADRELALAQHRLLHVALLVQDAQLVVAVDELDARVVALLDHRLVPLLELEHLLLDAVDQAVQVVDLGHQLLHAHLLLLDGSEVLVLLGAQRIAGRERVGVLEALLR
mmetsp:Transcript_8843/g.23427  ORF Transcript_8843/g.23427 Transcript_8843/m.23427 type:complete len:394 (+) Transcript_8843:295-1476(+)